MPELLFEIGCEELPSSAVGSGEAQLRANAERLLADARVPHGALEVFATPRRLAVLVRDVPEQQDPAVEEKRGPPADKAYLDDGSLGPAAVGFARANDITPDELVRKQTPQGEYLFAVRELPGRATADVLPEVLAGLIGSLQFGRAMRWDATGVRFPRPIRWLVALWGSEVLPVRYGILEAGRVSYGHRVFHPGPVELADAGGYAEALRAAGVIARRDERRDAVRNAAEKAAAEMGGRAITRDAVLDEVTDLVEDPSALTGRFDKRYLELPRDVLITAMEAHQRYFGVEDEQGQLKDGFVVVSNADPRNAQTIVAGNERVLRARLEDAVFFFREDMKVPLSARAEQLSGVVFHGQLGTMRDKLLRVGGLLADVTRWLGLADEDVDAVYTAADVYKADLLTHLVYEFPELQGVMGREYAMRDPDLTGQFSTAVVEKAAGAIAEHYLPRHPGDDVPTTPAGVALGLADRLDTLVGYLGVGLEPSGSEDPYALRRQANGFAVVSVAADARIPLDEAIATAHTRYTASGVEVEPQDSVRTGVRNLIVGRAEANLEREGIERMFVQAAVRSAWADLPELAARARALRDLHAREQLHPLAVAHERAYNLSRSADGGEVDPEALVHDAEQNLYAQLSAVEEIAAERAANRDFAGVLETLVPLSEVIDVFFDRDRGVLVMDPDERLKRNRLALLERVARVFALVADFSVIIPAELETEVAPEDDVPAP